MIAEGLEGESEDGGRDLTVDAMKAVALRLSAKYPIEVHAVRYSERGHVVDGFMVWTGPVERPDGTDWLGPSFHVPVRRRRRLRRRWIGPWREIQSVAAAASQVGAQARALG